MSVLAFFHEIGVELPDRSGEAPIQCFLVGHDERHPSASVNTETGMWFCHACDVGGRPYRAAIERGFPPAEAQALAEKHGLWIDTDPDETRRVPARPKKEKAMDPLPSEEALAHASAMLLDNEKVLERLKELRGWRRATIEELGLGFDGRRVVFPIRAADGRLVSTAAYLPGERNSAKKTLALTGRPRDMFPAPETISGSTVWIVEGEADVPSMLELGIRAVSIPGVGGWRRATPERFAGRRVLICLDADQKGRNAAGRLAGALAGHAAEVRVVDIAPDRDDGFDVTDLLLEARRNGGAKDAQVALLRLASGSEPLAPETAAVSVPRLQIVAASEIRPKSVRFLWSDGDAKRIPLGASTLIVGREGTGKSTLTCRITADTTRGRLPGALYGKPSDVVIATLEDPLREVVVPRLLAADADLSRVHFVTISGDAEEPFAIPDDLDQLAEAAASVGARLIFIDPLVATLPEKINGHRDQHVRRALAPLGELAARQDCAVAPVIHFNKATGSDALLRVGGSIAFVAAARSVLAFGYDPDDPAGEAGDRRVLAHPKANFSRKAKSLRCEIVATLVERDGARIETSRLEFGEECDVRAAEFFKAADPDERSKVEDAVEWLADELADREWHESGPVKAAAKAEGFKTRTLQRARERLEVEVEEHGFPARSEWRLPVVPTPEIAELGTTDQTGILEPKTGSDGPSCANHEVLAQLGAEALGAECAIGAPATRLTEADLARVRAEGVDPGDWS